MSAKAQKKPKTSRMFPALHEDVAATVSSHIPSLHFHKTESREEPNNVYSTFVKGHFNCYNPHCDTRRWASGQITILIRGFAGSEYDAEVFGQRCKECNRLGKLVMDKQSYVERVSRRVLVFAGVQLEPVDYVQKDIPSHEIQFCEGCKRGICKRSVK